jgi:hypothetical protein
VQERCTVCAEGTTGMEIAFGRTRWYSYVMYVKWTLISVHLEIVLVSAQDRCTVCAENFVGMEIFLGTPDGTPR